MGTIENPFLCSDRRKKGGQLEQRDPDESGALVDDGSFPD